MEKRKEFIRMESKGRSTFVYVCGIDLSRSLEEFSFDHRGSDMSEPLVTMTFNMKTLLELLSGLTEEQLAEAAEIFEQYRSRGYY